MFYKKSLARLIFKNGVLTFLVWLVPILYLQLLPVVIGKINGEDLWNDDSALVFLLTFALLAWFTELIIWWFLLMKIKSRDKELTELKFNGKRLKTKITNVWVIKYNWQPSNFCTITAEGRNENTWEMHTFKSVSIPFNKKMEQEKEIYVYLDPLNYSKYFIDTEEFMNKYV